MIGRAQAYILDSTINKTIHPKGGEVPRRLKSAEAFGSRRHIDHA
jgi:hypothetical protein